jgi:hypothetical protein
MDFYAVLARVIEILARAGPPIVRLSASSPSTTTTWKTSRWS